MIRSCPDLEAPLRAIRERLVDLHPVTKAAYYHRDLRAYCKRDTEGLVRLAGFLEGLRRVNATPGQALNAVSSPLFPGGGD